MKYIKTFENIKEVKYIGKYIVFYRRETKLYFGKVINITKRKTIEDKDKYFILISDLYPKIQALKEEPMIKFYLEKMNILNSFENKEEALEFYEIVKKSQKYNI